MHTVSRSLLEQQRIPWLKNSGTNGRAEFHYRNCAGADTGDFIADPAAS